MEALTQGRLGELPQGGGAGGKGRRPAGLWRASCRRRPRLPWHRGSRLASLFPPFLALQYRGAAAALRSVVDAGPAVCSCVCARVCECVCACVSVCVCVCIGISIKHPVSGDPRLFEAHPPRKFHDFPRREQVLACMWTATAATAL